MQQRRPRLGDILDDYCPRERRITNHAVVAMIDDQVKQTRCTTCDADHEYKQAKMPAPRRKKDGVVAGDPGDAGRSNALVPGVDASGNEPAFEEEVAPAASFDGGTQSVERVEEVDTPAIAEIAPAGAEADPDPLAASPGDDDGPVHRRLIRATLPRPEGQTPERKIPEFTVRQPGRGGREFDGNSGGGGQRHGRGRRAMRGPQGQSSGQPSRFGGPQQGNQPSRPGSAPRPPGNRPGQPGGQRGGGRPPGPARGPRQDSGPGRKRGR